MRLILEAFGRVVGFEASVLHVKMVSSEDQQDEPEEMLGHDPHGTTAAHIERRSDIEDAYGSVTPRCARPGFGFHGSQG